MSLLTIRPQDRSIHETIFHAARTLKGSAATVGLSRVADVAWGLEKRFSQLRTHMVPISDDKLALVSEAIQTLQGLIVEELEGAALSGDPAKETLSSSVVTHEQTIKALATAEQDLRRSTALFIATLEASEDGLMVVSAEDKIIHFNRRMIEMWKTSRTVMESGDREQLLAIMRHQLKNPDKFLASATAIDRDPLAPMFDILEFKDGRVLERVSRPQLLDGKHVGRVFSFRDVTEHRRTEERLSYLAHHDGLTGLPNRTLLDDRLSQAMHHAQRAGRLVGLLFLDLDRFKSINDTLGHVVGDLLLKEVAKRLLVCVRETDTVARLGGDEMAVVLNGLTRMEDAGDVAKSILDTLSQPVQLGGPELFMTASIGITIFPADDTSIDGLFKNADTAMYRAKEQGGNDFRFYTAEMNVRAIERLAMENSLRYALERQEFLVYYQPQIDLETGEIIGAEALLRWNNPEVGLIPPAQFIPLAEETGMIVSIGEWVLRSACAQAQAWHAAGFGPLQIAVNLSSRQFTHVNLVPMIADVLQETALPPGCLDLELTESIVMQDAEATIDTLHALNRLGIRFSIDDFGTGYLSLSYLKRFPIHILKIDPSFVRDVTAQATDAAIVTSIITLAHSLKLAVVAEGVETQAQAEFLRAHGCDGVQGCLFSRPLTDNGFIQLLKERRRFPIGSLAA